MAAPLFFDMGDLLNGPKESLGSSPASKARSLRYKFRRRNSKSQVYVFPSQEIFEIIYLYLLPSSTTTIDEAARSITRHLPRPPVAEDRPSTAEKTQNLSELWIICLEMASQIPYNHPALIKFARLVVRLTESGTTTQTRISDDPFYYTPRPQGLLLVLGEYHYPGGRESGPLEERDAVRWANSNAFVALLASYGLPVEAHSGLWRLREALEVPYSAKYSDSEIAAAAQWILHAGQWLYRWVKVPQEQTKRDEQSTQPGSQYENGKPGYSLERWHFWCAGFEIAASREEVSLEVKILAARAAQLMDAIESTFTL